MKEDFEALYRARTKLYEETCGELDKKNELIESMITVDQFDEARKFCEYNRSASSSLAEAMRNRLFVGKTIGPTPLKDALGIVNECFKRLKALRVSGDSGFYNECNVEKLARDYLAKHGILHHQVSEEKNEINNN